MKNKFVVAFLQNFHHNLAGVDLLLNLVKQNPKMEISAMSLPDGLGHLLH